MHWSHLPLALMAVHSASAAPPEARFRAVTVDAELKIGYGVAIADVDGDGKSDILLADAGETVWYRNPGWDKHRLTGKTTEKDNVCIAARDLDQDGKAEVAIGGEWNPGDTTGSGAVFTLKPGTDHTAPWNPAKQAHEPTVHRMNWVHTTSGNFLAVLPLHGRGNRDGGGDGIRFLGYTPPPEETATWPTFLIHQGFHMAHNFQPLIWNRGDASESLLVAEKEGVQLLSKSGDAWQAKKLTDRGCGEVRVGKLANGSRFIATVEPMHGSQVVIYPEREKAFATRIVADDTLNQGHALATGDYLGIGSDQVVAGWREPTKDGGKVGIRLYVPTAADGSEWKLHATIDDNTMACEDMRAADLNGDGKLDLIAAGRATKNLVIYWNETPTP